MGPDGTRVVLNDADGVRLLDATTFADAGAVPTPDARTSGPCVARRWLADRAVLLACFPDAARAPEAWIAQLDGGAPVRVAVADGGTAWAVGDGLVIGEHGELSTPAPDGSTWGVRLFRAGWDGQREAAPFAEVVPWMVAGVVGGAVHAYEAPYEGFWPAARYEVLDVATGERRTVLEAGPGAGLADVVPWGARGTAWSSM